MIRVAEEESHYEIWTEPEAGDVCVGRCLGSGDSMEAAQALAAQELRDDMAAVEALTGAPPSHWQPLASAPKGYDPGTGFHYVIFKGTSRGKSFSGEVVVTGYMSSTREPVHSYGYKLNITHWMEQPR